MEKKRKKLIWTADDRARSAEIRHELEARIAVLERRIAEQKKRGRAAGR